ncbi:hypothetical protein [Pseudonocardia sp.]|jgi:hypothetical protein|uniref:hypothetical protein n=1 Tax=Pseudonocardia sp. TaxID=60912 RepID=UPI003D15165A
MGDVALLAVMLRSDRNDVASYARLLAEALAGALPDGTVEVERRRGLADRVTGREGRPVAVLVHGQDRDLELREGARGVVEGEIRQVVRGVVIGSRPVGVDQWLEALAVDLNRIAARDAAAREALARLLRPGTG